MTSDVTGISDWESEIEIPEQLDERMLSALRFIILREERARLESLEEQSAHSEETLASLEATIDELSNRLGDDRALVDTLEPIVAPVISRKITENRDEMARTIGPVIGESIRVQLRNNREDIVDALYPVIGETVAKSVRESFREFQKSIDRQLRGPANIGRTIQAQMKGVSASELALRESLPFSINHIFLIQHDTGLLMTQHQLTDSEMPPGLIGSMLTAIRQFAHDSFGRHGTSSQLDEIQFGDERIIIESGQHAYVAAVVQGTEPTQFHTALRDYISNLHIEHGPALRDYDGDVASLEHLQTGLSDFSGTLSPEDLTANPSSMGKYTVPVVSGCLVLMLLGLLGFMFCLYATFKLWPLIFADDNNSLTSVTPTAIVVTDTPSPPTVRPTNTPLPPTATQEPTATPITAVSVTSEPATEVPTVVPPTATPEPPPSATPEPAIAPTEPSQVTDAAVTANTLGNVWVLEEPDVYDKRTGMLLKDTSVTLLAVYGDWVQLEWTVAETGAVKQGWILRRWIELAQPIPESLITPTPNS